MAKEVTKIVDFAVVVHFHVLESRLYEKGGGEWVRILVHFHVLKHALLYSSFLKFLLQYAFYELLRFRYAKSLRTRSKNLYKH